MAFRKEIYRDSRHPDTISLCADLQQLSNRLMAAVPGLLQALERLVVQLRNARRGDGENARDFAERDVLQVVEHDDGELRFGQAVEAAEHGAAILDG